MQEIDLVLNPYLLILLICIIYIIFYGKDGITNPIAIFFFFIALYVPLKYFFVIALNVEFASSSMEKFGKNYQSFAINNGGYLILFFLLLSGIIKSFFKVILKKPKIIRVDIKTSIAIPTIILSGIIFLLFLLFNPLDSILDGLTFRNFTQTKGMSYLSIVFDTLSLCSICQYLQARKLTKLTFLVLYLTIFYFLIGKSGPIVMMGLFIFTYLYSVRRMVPINSILFVGIALVIFALVHGAIRTEGNFISALTSILDGDKNNDFYTTAFIERISQLEEFCILSQLVSDNIIDIDFLSPLNIFVQFIPRAFWDTKPLFFNSNIMTIIYPEIFSSGVNFAFLFLGEFIYSFGITLGILLASIVMGYLLFICDIYLNFTKNNSEVFLFFYLVPYYYLMAGFNDGWMNTAVIPTILVNIIVLTIIGRFTIIPVSSK